MMDLLHIQELRPGAGSHHPEAPNAVNYDESKANPYTKLPDPLVLKDGQPVTTPAMSWRERRPQIVQYFDESVYGGEPANTPKVNWEVTSTIHEMNGAMPVITRKLVGHVDSSSYPQVNANIQVTLTTPAEAAGSVPVIMEFAFVFPPGFKLPK